MCYQPFCHKKSVENKNLNTNFMFFGRNILAIVRRTGCQAGWKKADNVKVDSCFCGGVGSFKSKELSQITTHSGNIFKIFCVQRNCHLVQEGLMGQPCCKCPFEKYVSFVKLPKLYQLYQEYVRILPIPIATLLQICQGVV
jgi:hypothetical protein